MKSAVRTATILVGVLYVTLGCISIFMFGSDQKSTLLLTMAAECTDKDGKDKECPWESIVCRLLFLIVLACHIPFVFFSGKEAVLIIIDELDRKSISYALEQKIKMLNKKEEVE